MEAPRDQVFELILDGKSAWKYGGQRSVVRG